MPDSKKLITGADAELTRLIRKMKSWMAGGMLRTIFTSPQGRIHEVMFTLVFWYGYLNGLRIIADPTCGVANRQFKPILKALGALGMEYHGCDINPANPCGKVCDVFSPDTLPDGDIAVYDPPFVPSTTVVHKRGKDYALNGHSLDDVRRFYSRRVFENFYSKDYKVVVVKGTDFYIPYTDELILFSQILNDYEGLYRLKSIHIYPHKSPSLPLTGALLRRKYAGRRVLTTHSNYMILFKAGWEPAEQSQNGVLEKYIK